MEIDNVYKTSRSLREGSSSIQRNNAMDVFSTSSRKENDEEAPEWTALEKSTTSDSSGKQILTASPGDENEIDVNYLGLQESHNLINRLVKVPEVDNEKFLLKIMNRFERVGMELPQIEVRFENLNVEAEARVGSRALPTFFNFFVNMIDAVLNFLHILSTGKKQLTILKDVKGILKPSRMTLLLGPPGSGKTTLLLALAAKLDSSLKFSGRVTYNGHEMHEFVPQRTAAYISQDDVHIAQMTVRETLAFSARCQGVGSRYEMLLELMRREKTANIEPDPDIDAFMKAAATEGQQANVLTNYILKVLGLEVCADTLVGDTMLRGISGGQRKRVTTGEMLVGPAKTLFMDEITSGLDSSTAFQIINLIRQYVHIFNGTTLISLLQPAPETYDLFDDIILLSDGQIVYQGPCEHVLEFFERMGFKCPERKGVADFLQEVTSQKDQQQHWARRDEPYRFVTVKEFSEKFQSFHVGSKLGYDLLSPFDKRNSHPAALATRKYGVSKKQLLKACFYKELLLMKRNSFVYKFKLLQLTIVAMIAMTLFLRTNMHRDSLTDGVVYTGALFFTVVMVMFNQMTEIPMTISKLPVFYKQRDLRFYPAWSYALPAWILKIPISCVEVAVWVSITYYAIGFDPDVGRFLRQCLLLFFVNQMASALFRSVAATARNVIVSNTVGTFVFLLLFALGGFVLSRDEIKKWWIWAYWCSPMMYGQNAIVINEFLGSSWRKVIPNSTKTLGVEVLKSRGFFPDAYWYWIGVGALVGFGALFNFGFTMALTFLNPFDKPQAVISEEPRSNEHDSSMRGTIQLPTQGSSSHSEIGNGITRSDSALQANRHNRRGMVLPFDPHHITFDEIVYSVDMPLEMKLEGGVEDKLVILNGVSGAFRPGILTALMGVSGAGKTTLMDVLAGRKTGGYTRGNITISGYPKKQETFARILGYCEQIDIHSPHVTVYESLLYSAWLRLPPEVDSETRKMFVEEVMELVELNPLRQALVGLPGAIGLSIEQRKRLTIAVELVANPSVIFMDEPTSGLDARAAAIVMRIVSNTVSTGRTVVCTIHQPSIDIFEAFDELFLLKEGGQEIYVGPLGRHSCHLIEYFEGIEGVKKIKDGYNPATWMLEVTSSSQEKELGIDFADIYRNSELCRRNKVLVTNLCQPIPGSKYLHFATQYSQSFSNQCLACFWKQHWSYWRNTPYTAVRFLFTTVMASLFGTMFWDLGNKTINQQDLFNAMGSMYTAVLFLGVQNAASVQPVVAIERTVFYRERACGMYSAVPYALAQVMIEIPYIFAQSIVYGVIVYTMIGFEWTAAKFFWYLFFMFFTFLYFTFYGMMAVAMTPNPQIAIIVSSAFYSIWNLFSGFIVPRTRIPIWWRWYYWASPISWTLCGLVASQFGDLQDRLKTGETVQEFLRNYYGFTHDSVGIAATVVFVFSIAFALCFAIALKLFNFQKR